MQYAAAMPERVKAPRRVVLTPAAFADTWAQKPTSDVCIGLRLISSAEVQAAKVQAANQVGLWHTNPETGRLHDFATADEAWNDGVMRHCVARATCDVNDVSQGYFAFAEDQVRDALTEEGIRRLWDELLILHVTSNVGVGRADDGDIVRVARILADGRAARALGAAEAIEVRTLTNYVLALLLATGEAHEAPVASDGDDEAEGDDTPGYTMSAAPTSPTP